MEKLHAEIIQTIENFQIDSKKALDGNKSAARRSRKSTSELGKLFKEWRQKSVEEIG